MKTKDIQIRDPFIFPHKEEKRYYLFGSTDKNIWYGPGQGFDCYRSKDLCDWEGPFPAFRPPENFWGTTNFWAPEVHLYRGNYYMFASFKGDIGYRGTQILASKTIVGPYVPLTEGAVTPPDWQCLDGTLFVDEQGSPWIVFCHEWVQVHNGAIYAQKLSEDLTRTKEPPVFLFNASEAPWVLRPEWPDAEAERPFPRFVTDGPFLHRNGNGALLMLWSSLAESGYAMGFAVSETGSIGGPWRQCAEPLWKRDGGHGMVFRDFDDRLLLTFHCPNNSPEERAIFVELEERGDGLVLRDSPVSVAAGTDT